MDAKNEKVREVRFSELILQIKNSYSSRKSKPIEAVCDVLIALTAMLFAKTHIAFGVCSLGISLLCACDRRTLPVFAGCVAGAFFLPGATLGYITVYSLVLLIRVIVSVPIRGRVIFPYCGRFFGEMPQLRIALSVIAGFGMGMYELFISSFARYAIFFAVSSVLFSAIGTLLFLGMYTSGFSLTMIFSSERLIGRSKFSFSAVYVRASACAFSVAAAYALCRYSVFGLNAGYCVLAACALTLSRRIDVFTGTACGILGGLAVAPVYAPSFALLGIMGGLITPLGEIYSLLFGVLAAVGYAVAVRSVAGFLAVFPEIGVTSLLVWPIFRARREDNAKTVSDSSVSDAEEWAKTGIDPRENKGGRRLQKLSSVFSDLSHVFYTVSGTTGRPAISEYFNTCDSICNKWCKKCPSKKDCWESDERSAYKAMQSISERLYRRGVTDNECVPESLVRRCPHIDEIVEEIRESCATLTEEKKKGDKSELLAFDYEMIAKLLREVSKNDMLDAREDVKMSCEISALLKNEFHIQPLSVRVLGFRQKEIAIRAEQPDALFDSEEAICVRLSEVCRERIGKMRTGAESGEVLLSSVPVYAASVGTASKAKGGEAMGDNFMAFANKDNFSYALICDGMGSGDSAAFTSGFSALFLSKMLGAGMSKTTSIKMLNNFIRYKGSECSSTIDLLEIDCLTGKSSFVKSGAASSFIKRGSKMFRISSKTMPIGIMKTVDAEKTDFDAENGDVIIMMSDGFGDNPEKSEWFSSVLGSINESQSPSDIAKNMLAAAVDSGIGNDDMTVSVIKVSSLPEFSVIVKK